MTDSTQKDGGAVATKPNCYECIHRRELPGDSHSRCAHSSVQQVSDDPLFKLFSLVGGGPPLPLKGIEVVGNPHGIRNGWFMWPVNFDPVWLQSCSGFEPHANRTEQSQ